MILTITCVRTPAQLVRVTLRAWSVGEGSRDVAEVVWDPHGPLSTREAAAGSIRRLLDELGAPLAS